MVSRSYDGLMELLFELLGTGHWTAAKRKALDRELKAYAAAEILNPEESAILRTAIHTFRTMLES